MLTKDRSRRRNTNAHFAAAIHLSLYSPFRQLGLAVSLGLGGNSTGRAILSTWADSRNLGSVSASPDRTISTFRQPVFQPCTDAWPASLSCWMSDSPYTEQLIIRPRIRISDCRGHLSSVKRSFRPASIRDHCERGRPSIVNSPGA